MLLMVTSSVFQKIMGKNHQNAFSIQRIIESCHFVQRHAKIGSWYNKYRFKLESISDLTLRSSFINTMA